MISLEVVTLLSHDWRGHWAQVCRALDLGPAWGMEVHLVAGQKALEYRAIRYIFRLIIEWPVLT